MDLSDHIESTQNTIELKLKEIKTEEATKTALILPLIRALGYDTTDPFEVEPEYTADRDTKNGEKVDFALKINNKVVILVECKWSGSELNAGHTSQLSRYFSCDAAKFAILTNGLQYQFYTDLDHQNKMDRKPFFSFNINEPQDHEIDELKKFSKSAFSLDDILVSANELKYTGEIKKILKNELTNPSESFVRYFSKQVYSGKLTSQKLSEFTAIVKKSREQFIDEIMQERFEMLSKMTVSKKEVEVVEDDSDTKDPIDAISGDYVESYFIIKSILCEVVDIKRVSIRSLKNHYLIVLDNTNRKPICKLFLNASTKQIGLITNKTLQRENIHSVDDIYNHKESLKNVISEYDPSVVVERKIA